MVRSESPLRRIPTALDESQARSIEAIRIGLEMVSAAHRALTSTLVAISRAPDVEARGPLYPRAMLHAWSIIDGVHRLSNLVEHLPGLRPSQFPEARVFLRATAGTERHRHYIQHLDRSIRRGEGVPQRPWGALTWVYCENPAEQRLRVLVLSPGTPPARVTWRGSGGKEITWPVGDVHLEVDGVRRSLSDDVMHCERLMQHLEASLTTTFQQAFGTDYETLGADVLVELETRAADAPADNEANGPA